MFWTIVKIIVFIYFVRFCIRRYCDLSAEQKAKINEFLLLLWSTLCSALKLYFRKVTGQIKRKRQAYQQGLKSKEIQDALQFFDLDPRSCFLTGSIDARANFLKALGEAHVPDTPSPQLTEKMRTRLKRFQLKYDEVIE